MSKNKNRIGEKYQKLLVIGEAPSKREPSGALVVRVIVRCDCGVEKETCYKQLKRGKIKSCGCLNELQKIPVNLGDTFNYWTLIEPIKGEDKRSFLCKCICGKENIKTLYSLRKNKSKSCGCQGKVRQEKIIKEKVIPTDTKEEQWKESVSYKGYYISTLGRLFNYNIQYMFPTKGVYVVKDKTVNVIKEVYKTFVREYDDKIFVVKGTISKLELRHKETENKIRNVYLAMKSRCNNPNATSYERYGGRGIQIDESFNNFDKFYYWSMENEFNLGKGLQIDRKDNDGNYSADNCRWVIQAENTRNTSRNVMTWELVDKIRNGEWKEKGLYEIASIVGCRVENIKNVRTFKTWSV